MTQLQLDSQNPMAAVLTPYLLDQQVTRQYYRDGQDLLRAWDFDQDADSGAAAYFNVVWRNLLADTFHDELPKDLWPDGGDRWVAAVTGAARRPAQRVVGRPRHRRRGRGPRRHPAPRAARGPRRDDVAPGAEPRRVELGLPAPARPRRADAGRLGHRAGRVAVQPRRLGGRRRHGRRRRRRAGTPRPSTGPTSSPPRRRCGWSSRSPTSTTPAGST